MDIQQRIASLKEEAKRVMDAASVVGFEYDDKSYSTFTDETVKLVHENMTITINRNTKKEKKQY